MVCIRYFERIKSRDKIMNYNSQTNTAMPVYDRECVGHLLNAYTYDANRFNNMIMQGSIQRKGNARERAGQCLVFKRMASFYQQSDVYAQLCFRFCLGGDCGGFGGD